MIVGQEMLVQPIDVPNFLIPMWKDIKMKEENSIKVVPLLQQELLLHRIYSS